MDQERVDAAVSSGLPTFLRRGEKKKEKKKPACVTLAWGLNVSDLCINPQFLQLIYTHTGLSLQG